jgi:hypothetical protein
MCSSTASTTRYQGGMPRRRGAMRKASSTAQPGQGPTWADGDFDADHGFGLDGVGRSAHWSRMRGPNGVDAAAVRAPLLCISFNSSVTSCCGM